MLFLNFIFVFFAVTQVTGILAVMHRKTSACVTNTFGNLFLFNCFCIVLYFGL